MPELDTYFETQLKQVGQRRTSETNPTRYRKPACVWSYLYADIRWGPTQRGAQAARWSAFIYTSDGPLLPRLPYSSPSPLVPRICNHALDSVLRSIRHRDRDSTAGCGIRITGSERRIHPPEIRILGWGGRTCLFVGGGLTRGALICFASLSVLIWFNPGFLRVSFGDFEQVSGSVYWIFVESSLFCSGCGRIVLDLELTHRSWKFYHL